LINPENIGWLRIKEDIGMDRTIMRRLGPS